MKKLIPLVLTMFLFLGEEKLFSQIYIQDEHYSLSTPIDSIFETYIPPEIPSENKTGTFNDEDLIVTIFIQVDTNGRAKKVIVNPLYGVGNKYNKKSKVWKKLINNIFKASKQWIFKPLYYKNNPDDPKQLLSLRSNKSAVRRPFYGRQSILLIMKFSGYFHGYFHGYSFTNIYYLIE